MFSFLLISRRIIVGVVFFLLCVVGSLLYYLHVVREGEQELAETQEQVKQWEARQQPPPIHADGTWQATPDAQPPDAAVPANVQTPQKTAEIGEVPTFKAVQTSTNPLFADGVPEHLQCPEEWIGSYLSELPSEAGPLMQKIAAEVIDKYNPNRPLISIWDQYIAAENAYQNDADPLKKNLAVGANRFDWGIQSILDFPEIVILGLEDGSRFGDMRMIDMGIQTPNWNVHLLPDGREFRAADGYYYTVFSHSGTDDNYRESHISFGHSGVNATPVTIDLANTSDAELERLSGWNYNINPYTSGLYQLGDNPSQIELGDYK